MKQIIDNNILYCVGEDAADNHKMFDLYRKENNKYWWFHLSEHSSPHVIACTENINREIIVFAGNLVKQNSKYNHIDNISIDYTMLRNIRKTFNIGEVALLRNPMIIRL